MTGQQWPSVGRIVHYVSHGTPILADGSQAFPSLCRAAIITEIDQAGDTRVGLMVANPTGLFFHSLPEGGCEYHEWSSDSALGGPAAGGTWHWPERV